MGVLMSIETLNYYRYQTTKFCDLQSDLWEWQTKNFGATGPEAPPRHPFLGMCEEAGELVHSVLKLSQGIRGTKEEHIENIKDAIGDIMIYMINFFYRGNLGYVDPSPNFFIPCHEQTKYSMLQLEMLAFSIYKNIARLGLYFEPSFLTHESISFQYRSSIKEASIAICDDLVYLCNLLDTNLYSCIENVWVNVLQKRNWKVNPINGVY